MTYYKKEKDYSKRNNRTALRHDTNSITINKRKIKWSRLITLIATILTLIALPFLVKYLYETRGYFAVGGEWFVPFFPTMIYITYDVFFGDHYE